MPPQAVKRVGSRRAVFGSCKQEFKEIWGVIWDEMEEKEATPDPSPTIERVCDAKYILGLNLKFAPPRLSFWRPPEGLLAGLRTGTPKREHNISPTS